jgi:hypothetical protein
LEATRVKDDALGAINCILEDRTNLELEPAIMISLALDPTRDILFELMRSPVFDPNTAISVAFDPCRYTILDPNVNEASLPL